MPAMLLLALAPAIGPLIIRDPPRGPTPFENRTLSQPHRNMDDRMFPDMAVKELRIDGDTLYVRVANEGKVSAKGPIKVIATVETHGAKTAAAPVRVASLKPGESRWLPVRGFALEGATTVLAAVAAPTGVPAALDRSGQLSDSAADLNEDNNSLSASGSAIVRGKPE